jgi:hypothetical protein
MTRELLARGDRPWGLCRAGTAGIALVIAGWLCLLPGTPARAATATPAASASAIDRACGTDLQLAPGSADYLTCVATLRRVAAGTAQDDTTARHRAACLQQGLQPGTPGFATCVVDTAQSEPTRMEQAQ